MHPGLPCPVAPAIPEAGPPPAIVGLLELPSGLAFLDCLGFTPLAAAWSSHVRQAAYSPVARAGLHRIGSPPSQQAPLPGGVCRFGRKGDASSGSPMLAVM